MDSSAPAIALADESIEVAGYSKLANFMSQEVERYMAQAAKEKRTWDIVILGRPLYYLHGLLDVETLLTGTASYMMHFVICALPGFRKCLKSITISGLLWSRATLDWNKPSSGSVCWQQRIRQLR